VARSISGFAHGFRLKFQTRRHNISDMSSVARHRLLLLGAQWGAVMAAVPSVVAFDDPFTISPFLVAAHLCAAASGAFGFWLAGRRAADSGAFGGVAKVLGTGAFQALAAAPLAALSIWLMMAINMSGFSEENLDELSKILNIFRRPEIWLESSIVALAVFVYAVVVGLLLSPVSGVAIRLLARP
jgi:hypothetical protein